MFELVDIVDRMVGSLALIIVVIIYQTVVSLGVFDIVKSAYTTMEECKGSLY
jgi:hypothetical protein